MEDKIFVTIKLQPTFIQDTVNQLIFKDTLFRV